MTGTFVLVAILVIVVFVVLLAMKGKSGNAEFPYRMTGSLLSKAERSFYGALVKAVGDDGQVFTKVRVADVLSPQKGLDKSTWQRAFNAISSKHFDFVVCDASDMKVLLGVELDDASHNSKKAQKRDGLINGACASAGLPLMRVKASRGYVIADLRSEYLQLIGKPEAITVSESQMPQTATGEVKSETTEPVNHQSEPADVQPEQSVQEAPSKDVSPNCPKCGSDMVLRTTNKGDNAGRKFWGCSAFPKCRSMVPVENNETGEALDTAT